jgi:hypothetical protein
VGTGVPSYKGFRFPVEIISHCVWLYYRARARIFRPRLSSGLWAAVRRVRPGGGSPTSHRTRGSPATCNRDPISSAQGLIQGGGGEAREFSLSPPWSYLPALSWGNASQGGDLSTSPRPFEPPISVPGHPRAASLLARTSVSGAARSTARILTVTRGGGELVGEAS